MSNNAPLATRVAIASAPLEPWDLPPGAVVAGTPATSGCVIAQSADGCVVRGLWECTPGSFRWTWTYDETLVVVRGRARVHVDGGPVVELGPGDLACFDRGQSATWETVETLRKAFHALSPEPLPF